jgi:hypothetical protein
MTLEQTLQKEIEESKRWLDRENKVCINENRLIPEIT